jgi:hypothetical protein
MVLKPAKNPAEAPDLDGPSPIVEEEPGPAVEQGPSLTVEEGPSLTVEEGPSPSVPDASVEDETTDAAPEPAESDVLLPPVDDQELSLEADDQEPSLEAESGQEESPAAVPAAEPASPEPEPARASESAAGAESSDVSGDPAPAVRPRTASRESTLGTAELPPIEYPRAYYPDRTLPSERLAAGLRKPRTSIAARFIRRLKSLGRHADDAATPEARGDRR